MSKPTFQILIWLSMEVFLQDAWGGEICSGNTYRCPFSPWPLCTVQYPERFRSALLSIDMRLNDG